MTRLPTISFLAGLALIGAGLFYNMSTFDQRSPTMSAPPVSASVPMQPSGSVARPYRTESSPPPAVARSSAEAALPERPRSAGNSPAVAERQLYERVAAKLRTASYALNHPEVMFVNRRSQVSLTLAADEVAAVEKLKQQFDKDVDGTTETGKTKYAPVMAAVLRGKDFKIDPSDRQERTVLPNVTGPTVWTWYVEPREAGAGQLLVLELFARVAGNDNLPPVSVKTFESRINVDVKMLDYVIDHARRMSPVAQALTGAGSLLSLFGFFGGLRRRWGGAD